MKRLLFLFSIAILAFPLFWSCSEKEIPVASVTLSQPASEMFIGESITLKAIISPSDATVIEVIWASSKQSVASVDQSGKVVAIAEGTSTITATVGGKMGSCVVTVSKRFVDVSSINLDKTSASLKVGEKVTLTATVKPDDATDKTVTWSTSDASVVAVSDGVVTAKMAGTATITAKAGDKEATCAITVEASEPIVFADAAAKYACVEKYDTNGDGEVSVDEAEAATTFEGLFTNWKGVKSFDEIKYFKNVHNLGDLFSDCNKLVSITIPENITEIASAFYRCTSLKSVVLPSGIKEIANYTFADCSSLESITIPSEVTVIGGHAFSGCSSLSEINLPSSLTYIGDNAFYHCSSLISVHIPEGVSGIGSEAFSCCFSLSDINLPFRLTTIAASTFYECHSLTSISIPEGVTSIKRLAFCGCPMWKLELPSSISSLGDGCFIGIDCVILHSPSPVSIQPETFAAVGAIFVPSNMIELYGAMTNWTNYYLRLHPISSYKEKNEYTLAVSGAVDMGTSVKWAAYNLGATKPEGYGDYYAWGETQTKTNYNWSTYKWSNGSENKLTKYCDKANYWDGTGTPDGKIVLDLSDDAARANWGSPWRMPTKAEFNELIECCLWESATYEGINGYKVYGIESGKIIFLPRTGFRTNSSLNIYGEMAFSYWSSSLDTDYFPYRAWYLRGDSYYIGDRAVGVVIRPVCE